MLRVILAALWLACAVMPAVAAAVEDVQAGNEAFHGARYGDAIAAFTRAIESGELESDALVIAYNNRGVTYNEIGDYDQAIGDYREALRLRPGDPTAAKNLRVSLTLRGVARANVGDTARALADYAAAIEAEPESARPWLRRAQLHMQNKDLEAALADLEAASIREPTDPDVSQLLAEVRKRIAASTPDTTPLAGPPATEAPAPGVEAPEPAADVPPAAGAPAAQVPAVELPETAGTPTGEAPVPGEAPRAGEQPAAAEPAVPARRDDPAAAPPTPQPAPPAPQPAPPAPQPSPEPPAPQHKEAAPASGSPDYRATGPVFMRRGPQNDAPPVGTLQEGEAVTVLGEQRGWLHIRRQDGSTGYVYRRWLEPR